MKMTQELTKKQIKHKRIFWYLSSRFLSRGGALFGVGMTYGLFNTIEEPQTGIAGMFSFALIITFFFFYKDVKEYAKTKAETVWKDSVDEAKWLFVIIMILAFIQWAKMGLGNIEVLMLYLAGAQTLALYPSVLHRKYVRLAIEEEKNKGD